MDDPLLMQKYQKYKLKVKLWEQDFKQKNGRIPSKYDIREASKEIRDSYKMYYKLKTSFLENTLNDVLEDDGFNVLEPSHADSGDISFDESFAESVNGGPRLPLDVSTFAMTAEVNNPTNISNLDELAHGFIDDKLNESHGMKEFEPVEQLPLNERAWGSIVSKQQDRPTQGKIKNCEKKPFKSNLNHQLFRSTSFSKRNPRKSLSRSMLNTSVSGSHSNVPIDKIDTKREVLPDLETILIQKSKEQQLPNPLQFVDKSKEAIKTRVDESWLNRNTITDGVNVDHIKEIKDLGISGKQTYGLSNIDVAKMIPQLQSISKPITEVEVLTNKLGGKDWMGSDSDAVVSNSEDECEHQDYRHIVKRRRALATNDNTNDIKTITTNEEQASTKSKLNIAEENQNQPVLNDETLNNVEVQNATEEKDFSADDDKDKDYVLEIPKLKRKKLKAKQIKSVKKEAIKKSTEKNKSKAQTRKSAKGRISEDVKTDCQEENFDGSKPPNPDDLKYTLALEKSEIIGVPRINMDDLEAADSLAQRYINTHTFSTGRRVASPNQVVNEKREAARKKLQATIASGKLNENFVTIDIKKKTFVRGKKSVNYSKYKKKLWKHKKYVNALSGPNMNMGGCNGGVLTCFTCGQVGHYAQNCKIKGDNLLPLTVHLEEDPSPFPTLEEAEIMATQNAIAVHSRNIAKLPAAANPAFYRSDDDVNDELEKDKEQNLETENDVNDVDAEMLIETDDEVEGIDFNAAEEANHLSPIKKYVGHKIPEEFLIQVGLCEKDNATKTNQHNGLGPLYDLNSDGTVKNVTPEVLEVLRMFGHTAFRKGQDRAIMRILSGISTLVTLSTGSGKSLCYQLPAYMYSRQMKSITLVISPLVSLMEDQVTGVPHFLRAHCLHTNQTPQHRQKILQLISDGEIDILLVSPEAVVAGERSTGFGSILRQLPPIAFACIDEVHCVSQWSHNFRPSYLMICKVLKNNLGVKTVLGLTATATMPTRLSIINHLSIHDGESGIISDTPLPDNLVLSVSKDENRDAALLQLLNAERFKVCQSIIIYCTRRDECERIAGFIRTCMLDRKPDEQEAKRKRKRINWNAEPYHAGMPSSRRRTIQNAFMKNELRIVVATIAFGMGINKSDIRSVIHYNMPRNFESYVQEIGRAGRDGKTAHCHLFLDARGGDQNELRRHIYANSIDRHVIRKLLQRLFVPCSCQKNFKKDDFSGIQKVAVDEAADQQLTVAVSESNRQVSVSDVPLVRKRFCPGHEIGFSIEKTVEALDIPEENISTLLCYMELDSRWNINVLSSAYTMAKVISYGGPKYLKHAAKDCPPLAMVIALEIKNNSFKEDSNIIEFSAVDIAAAIGWNSGVVKYQLKNLEWIQVNGNPKRSPISVNFYDLGFHVKAPGDFTTEETDDALDTLYNRSVAQEKTQLMQLQYLFQGLSSVAFNTNASCTKENFSSDRSDQLKSIIRDYFLNDFPKDLKLEMDNTVNVPDDHIISDVHAMLNLYPENNFTGRNLARIFHGISSPNYPAIMWGRCNYWRAHSKTDFNRIVRLANATIIKLRT